MIIIITILILVYIVFNIYTDWYLFEATLTPYFILICIMAVISVCAHIVAMDKEPYYTYDYKITDNVLIKTTKVCLPAKYDVDFCDVVSVESILLEQVRFNNSNTK